MLFVQNQYQYLVAQSIEQEDIVMHQFANQEYTIDFKFNVAGQKCVIVGSFTASPEESLQLLLLLAWLKKSGACQLILFSPYLGYQRQDAQQGFVSGLQAVDTLLAGVGLDRIVTIEPHWATSLLSLDVSVDWHTSESIFYQDLTDFVDAGFGFIFPDAGAAERHAWILQKFPTTAQGFFHKHRYADTIKLTNFQGKLSSRVILYDDILDSGQTLIQACIILRSMGVQEIVIFVTHGFFHGNAWENLFEFGVTMLYCTNSVPAAQNIKHPKIIVKSINFLLQKTI